MSGAHQSYDWIAPFYDLLAAGYSGGGIVRAKLAHVADLQAGHQVLYVGAGTGAECLAAARRGARVTALDQSPKMLARLRGRLDREREEAELIEGDIFEAAPQTTFDYVVAPFFLDVFARQDVPRVFSRLAELTGPGGRVVTVDFRAPVRGPFGWLQRLIHLPPLVLFWLTTGNAWHELYDYCKILGDAELPWQCVGRRVTRAWGLPILETLIWERA